MAREEHTTKSEQELADRAWDIAHHSDVATYITVDGDTAVARPMSPRVDTDAGRIEFLTSAASRKVAQAEHSTSSATVFCTHGNGYVSFAGSVRVSNDRARIKQLWSAFDKAWWDSAEDPDIRLVVFTPSHAELWDGPNKIVAGALMLGAAVTGAKPKLGDHAQLRNP